ncbi:MAG: hypothetical protein H8D23_04720 [Candidatus Brocadiales bacterium]|nr:hypothetical protein [Candidatus Brocadiales bacterium]
MNADYSTHFWERAFGRPRVQQNHANIEAMLKNVGAENADIEDIPELRYLLNIKNKRFVFQESPNKPKIIFGIKENPTTGKHSLVAVTGLNPEHSSTNLEDITPVLLQLSRK